MNHKRHSVFGDRKTWVKVSRRRSTLLQAHKQQTTVPVRNACMLVDKDIQEDLIVAAKLSHLAYTEPEPMAKKDPHIYFYNGLETDAQAFLYVMKDTKAIWLVFRGSTTKQDALINLDVRQTRHHTHPSVHIHSGFYRQYIALRKRIMDDVLRNLDGIDALYVCGHSLGGALATIASTDIADTIKTIHTHCYTFGCPRVGNAAFIEWFNKTVYRHWRVVNTQDPVPMIPISARFQHVCKALVIDDACRAHVQNKDVPWYARIIHHVKHLDVFHLIQDHDCKLYVERLNKLFAFDDSSKLYSP